MKMTAKQSLLFAAYIKSQSLPSCKGLMKFLYLEIIEIAYETQRHHFFSVEEVLNAYYDE